MIKNLESLGTVLTREEQKEVQGGVVCLTVGNTTVCYDTLGTNPYPVECIPDGLPGSGGPGVGCPAGTACSPTGQCI